MMKEVKIRLVSQSQNPLKGIIMSIISTVSFGIKTRIFSESDIEARQNKYVLKERNNLFCC